MYFLVFHLQHLSLYYPPLIITALINDVFSLLTEYTTIHYTVLLLSVQPALSTDRKNDPVKISPLVGDGTQ